MPRFVKNPDGAVSAVPTSFELPAGWAEADAPAVAPAPHVDAADAETTMAEPEPVADAAEPAEPETPPVP